MHWQPVTALAYVGASRYTGYIAKTIMLTLGCGHQQYRKASRAVPRRAYCKECEREQAAAAAGKSYRCLKAGEAP